LAAFPFCGHFVTVAVFVAPRVASSRSAGRWSYAHPTKDRPHGFRASIKENGIDLKNQSLTSSIGSIKLDNARGL